MAPGSLSPTEMAAYIFVGVVENLRRGFGRRWWSLRGSWEMEEEDEEKEERDLEERRGERGLGAEERSFVRVQVVVVAAIAAGTVRLCVAESMAVCVRME